MLRRVVCDHECSSPTITPWWLTVSLGLIGEVADLVAQVTDGQRLVEQARRLRPDIVVSDISMPGMSGIDAMRQLKAEHSSARFIFMTVYTDPSLAAEAMRAGAAGYVLKHAAGEELHDAIRR